MFSHAQRIVAVAVFGAILLSGCTRASSASLGSAGRVAAILSRYAIDDPRLTEDLTICRDAGDDAPRAPRAITAEAVAVTRDLTTGEIAAIARTEATPNLSRQKAAALLRAAVLCEPQM